MISFIGIIGVLAILAVAYFMSNDKKNINYRAIAVMFGLQIVSTFILMNTSFGFIIIETISSGFEQMISYGMEGVDFVVGGWYTEGEAPFFIGVMMIIIFTSTVLSVLTHIRVLPLIIKYVGGALSRVTGLPRIESFSAVNNIIFGQNEAILAIKDHIGGLSKNRLFIVSTSAMASVSVAIVGAYMTLLPPKYVLIALVLNMFSALIVSSIVAPVKASEHDEDIKVKDLVQTRNIFDAIGQGAMDGGKVALIVSAMLVAYLGLLTMINGVMASLIGVELTTILSYLFAPIAFIMGVPMAETLDVGSVMGTKILANEFVAMMYIQPFLDYFSTKATGIISTFLISFGAFGSIGMIAGTVQAVNGEKAKEVTDFGLKLLVVATMSSMLSATVVGLFL